jgi:hypothetical protein
VDRRGTAPPRRPAAVALLRRSHRGTGRRAPALPEASIVARTSQPALDADAGAMSRSQRALARRRNVLLAQHHRDQGWSTAQIAHLLDRAPATIRGYLHDPTGEKAKTRKASYAGACGRCGAPTSGADGKGRASRHCQQCKPQSRARWTRELVRGAHHFWQERFGFIASSVDWSGTHARRRGGAALERYRAARWPSQSVIRRLYGTPEAARADAFPTLADSTRHVDGSANGRDLFQTAVADASRSGPGGQPGTQKGVGRHRALQPAPPV